MMARKVLTLKNRLIMVAAWLLTGHVLTAQIDTEKYLWQYPLEQNLVLNPELQVLLQEEMQKVIDPGTLSFRPLTCRYSDQIYESYFLYREPGRILQTIALAYPYLSPSQQIAVRSMVPALLNSDVHAPWAEGPLAANAGTRREYYLADSLWGLHSGFGTYRPAIQGVYSLWLYIYRTGDTASVQPHYEDIRDFYNNKTGAGIDPGNLYGTMCSHIGMARLARIFNDTPQVIAASNRLAGYLELGLDMHYVDSMAYYGRQGWNAPYAGEYDTRRDNFIYRGFIFLNLSPEIGRYLRDTLGAAVMQRHTEGMQMFPLWWLNQSPYFVRWTGDEGIGIPSEMSGMIMPVERWVVRRDASVMRSYMQSAPAGIGDCYWLESLVYALESDATDSWVDVRDMPFTTDGTAVPVNSNLSGTIATGSDTCFSAIQTITLAGSGQNFTVEEGGTALLVAGHSILLKAGTMVDSAGYLSGRISADGAYCSFNPVVPALPNVNQNPGANSEQGSPVTAGVRIYPNPTAGFIKVAVTAPAGSWPISLEVRNIMGERLLLREGCADPVQTVDFSAHPAGMYLVLVTSGQGMEVIKVIKSR